VGVWPVPAMVPASPSLQPSSLVGAAPVDGAGPTAAPSIPGRVSAALSHSVALPAGRAEPAGERRLVSPSRSPARPSRDLFLGPPSLEGAGGGPGSPLPVDPGSAQVRGSALDTEADSNSSISTGAGAGASLSALLMRVSNRICHDRRWTEGFETRLSEIEAKLDEERSLRECALEKVKAQATEAMARLGTKIDTRIRTESDALSARSRKTEEALQHLAARVEEGLAKNTSGLAETLQTARARHDPSTLGVGPGLAAASPRVGPLPKSATRSIHQIVRTSSAMVLAPSSQREGHGSPVLMCRSEVSLRSRSSFREQRGRAAAAWVPQQGPGRADSARMLLPGAVEAASSRHLSALPESRAGNASVSTRPVRISSCRARSLHANVPQ